MSKIEDYCRKNREKSISPSISLEISQTGQLTDLEKIEKNYYNNTVTEMTKEVCISFDDLFKNINYFLTKNLHNLIKNLSENQLNDIICLFFEKIFRIFKESFDELEVNCILVLKMDDFKQDLVEFLNNKSKRSCLVPILNNEVSAFSPLKNFDNEKNKMSKLMRDNLQLKMELALERKIEQSIEQNFDKVKEKFAFLEEQVKKKPDMSYIDKNIDIMSNKLKMMKREISQLNI